MEYRRFIAQFFYDKRLTDLENGMPVHKFWVVMTYDSCNDERYKIAGDNTGPTEYYNSIESIVEKYGKPFAIDLSNDADDYKYILNFTSNIAVNMQMRKVESIKKGEFIWDELTETQKERRILDHGK